MSAPHSTTSRTGLGRRAGRAARDRSGAEPRAGPEGPGNPGRWRWRSHHPCSLRRALDQEDSRVVEFSSWYSAQSFSRLRHQTGLIGGDRPGVGIADRRKLGGEIGTGLKTVVTPPLGTPDRSAASPAGRYRQRSLAGPPIIMSMALTAFGFMKLSFGETVDAEGESGSLVLAPTSSWTPNLAST